MPVYGKNRSTRTRPNYPKLGQRINVNRNVLRRRTAKRYYPADPWDINRTPYLQLAKIMGFSPRVFLRKRIRETGKPATVVDWGCGTGDAIRTIGEEKNVRAFGYGKDSYAEWAHPSNVQFIQESPQRALRYFKKLGGIDLIYSHSGIHHLAGKGKNGNVQFLIEHIHELIPMLKVGGRIVFNPVVKTGFTEFWQEALDPTQTKIRVAVKDFTVFIERLA